MLTASAAVLSFLLPPSAPAVLAQPWDGQDASGDRKDDATAISVTGPATDPATGARDETAPTDAVRVGDREPSDSEPSGPEHSDREAGDPGAGDPGPDRLPSGASEREAQRMVLDLPVTVGGEYVRDLPVEVTMDGRAFLRPGQLADVLADLVEVEVLEALGLPEADDPGAEAVPVQAFSRGGLTVAYDPATLGILADLPIEMQRTRIVSVRGQGGERPQDAIAQAGVSISVSLFAQPSYAFAGPDAGYEPFRARAEGFVNAGGFDGVNLAWRGMYEEGAAAPSRLEDVLVFRDDFERAIRYAAGTIQPLGITLYSRPAEVVGVGISRDYAAIRPFANLRPDGATSFTLSRESTVFIEVNGVVEATEDLRAGTYDLRDLPVRPGANDVLIYTEDGPNRIELAVLSAFVDTSLLAAGRSNFSAVAGLRRERGGALPQTGGDVAYAGFYERGVTNQLTLGGGAEGVDGEVLLTARAAVGLPVGLATFEVGWREGAAVSAPAATLRYNWRSDPRMVRGQNVDLQLAYRGAGFGTVTERALPGAPSRGDTLEANARYGLRVGRAALSANLRAARTGAVNTVSGTAGVTTNWRGLSVGVTARMRWQDEPGLGTSRKEAVLFTVSRSLGRGARARASYDTEERRTQLQASRFGGRALGNWNANAILNDSEVGQGAEVTAGLITNRAELGLAVRAQEVDERQTGRIEATLGVGVGVAGGRVAVGRPPRDVFVIAGTHGSLEDRRMSLVQNGDEVLARTDALGPALAPLRGGYRTERAEVRVVDLPVGYDIGSGQIVTYAGARAGYGLTIGSGASNTLMGTLLRPDGSPMALAVGQLVPVGAAEGTEGPAFFTNKTGRFVAEGLKAGAYEVRLKPTDRVVGTLTIPEEADGLVRVGELRMTRP